MNHYIFFCISKDGIFSNGQKIKETEIYEALDKFDKIGYKLVNSSDNHLSHIMVREESTKTLLEVIQKTIDRILTIIRYTRAIQRATGMNIDSEMMIKNRLTEKIF